MAQTLPETYCGTQVQKFGLDGIVYRTDLKMSDLKAKLKDNQVIVKVISTAMTDFFYACTSGSVAAFFNEGGFLGYNAAGEIVVAGSELDQSIIGKYVQATTFEFQGSCCEYVICNFRECMVFERNEWVEEIMQVPDFNNTQTAYGICDKIRTLKGKNVISLMGGSNLSRYINRILASYDEGYRVLNVIRNPKKIDELKQDLNTEHVVDMENIEEKMKEFTGETHNTIILDPLGGEFASKVFHAANFGSTMLIYEAIVSESMNVNTKHMFWTEKNITFFNQLGFYEAKTHEQTEELKNNIKKNIRTLFKTKCYKKFTQKQLPEALKELHSGIPGGSRILIVPAEKENPEN